VLAPFKKPATITNKNAELTARLEVSEEQIRHLRRELEGYEALKKAHEQALEKKNAPVVLFEFAKLPTLSRNE